MLPPNVASKVDGNVTTGFRIFHELLLGDSHIYRYPRFSADSGQVAVGIEAERGDIYVVDVQRRTLRRLTRTGSPTWTLDGQRVTFASRRPQISAEEK